MIQNNKQNLVLIGNGMAGMRTVEEILKLEPEKYSITVFGDEPYGNYSRIMLSPVLANEKTLEEVSHHDGIPRAYCFFMLWLSQLLCRVHSFGRIKALLIMLVNLV